ncbi:hypothetical protein Bca4012_071332 [Brassica carinata]
MADLSVQTCVVSSEGCNQVVVHGSCGLLDANPSRLEFFVSAPSLVSLAIAEAFALDCLFGFMCLCPLCRHRSWDLAAWYRPFGSQRTHLASRFSGVINWLGVSLWSLLAVPRPRYFFMVAAVASACSVWEAFQALCDVVYNPGLLVVSSGNTPLLFVERLIDGIGYMFCGVHRRLATP